jgi:agmatinase
MSVDNGGFQTTDARLQPRYTGLATLLRSDYTPDAAGLDVALVGVPTEFTVFRNGTRWGPSQVREMSRSIRPVNAATGLNPFTRARIADIGDAPVNPFSSDRTNEQLEEFFAALSSRGTRAVAVGGDHGITLPILRALGRTSEPLGVLQIDAHHDTHDELYGVRDNHATAMRRAVEEGIVDPRRVVQLGLRGSLYAPDEMEWARAQGFTEIGAEAFLELGPQRTAELVRETLRDGPAYLTLDIDGLDPTVAPGTGVPEPGGLGYNDCLNVLRGVAGTNFVGADLTEVSPPLDPSGNTALVAANLLFEQLCLVVAALAPGTAPD